MSNKKKRADQKKAQKKGQFNKNTLILVGVAVVLIAGYFFFNGGSNDNNTDNNVSSDYSSDSSNTGSSKDDRGSGQLNPVQTGGDLKIPKDKVTETAQFFPYNLDGAEIEVVAVKASDGTIRTAFNTCQVCYGSGRGYYKQEGNELICQNCGNRFAFDQVEVAKGSCNPVPIFKEDKKDKGNDIIIPKSTLKENQEIFANWRTE